MKKWLAAALCTPSTASSAAFTRASQWAHIMPLMVMVFLSISSASLLFVSVLSYTCGAAFATGAAAFFRRLLQPRSRRALLTTHTELRLMAAAAIMGFSVIPNAGYSAPAATGMPMAL